MWGWVKLHSYPCFLSLTHLRGTGGREEPSESTLQPHNNVPWWHSFCDPRAGQPMTFKQGAGWWDSAEPSNSPEVRRVTPDMLWCHKGPKQQFVIAMKNGPFLSRPKSLLRYVNCVSAVSLLPVRLHYCNGEQRLIHWLQFSPGFCTKSKCCFTNSNNFGLYVWSCSVKRNCEFGYTKNILAVWCQS